MTNSEKIYEFLDYKEFLRWFIDESPPGTVSRLAEAAECQRSYLSDVLRSHVHLTPDHAFGISGFLKLNSEASTFFLTMVNYARASKKDYRASLHKELVGVQQERKVLSRRINKDKNETVVKESRYYSSWHYGALHIATSIDGLNSVKSLAAKFGVDQQLVSKILEDLCVDGFVLNKGDKFFYDYEKGNPHLPNESIMTRVNHSNWRALALSRPLSFESDINYSSVFAVSKKDFPKLREQLLGFLEEQRFLISNSGSEEVICFCCDLFAFK